MTQSISMSADAQETPRTHRRPWQDQAMVRIGELDILSQTPGLNQAEAGEMLAVLTHARALATSPHQGPWHQAPGRWFYGSPIEETWRLIHVAQQHYLRALPAELLPDRAQHVAHQGSATLGASDPDVVALKRALRVVQLPTHQEAHLQALRATAIEVLRRCHDSTDAAHRQARELRNRILVTSGLMWVLAGLLLLGTGAFDFGLFSPPPGSGLSDTTATGIAMFFGCLGALISALPSLASQPDSKSPFNLPTQQAILKVSAGAWSALIGLLAATQGLAAQVGAGSEQEPTGSPVAAATVGTLALLSVFFGAGQEAVTRFVDRKARDYLETA